MKSTQNGLKGFKFKLDDRNPIIISKRSKYIELAKKELSKLESNNNTVIITDPYLFADDRVETALIEILNYLKSSKIIYATVPKKLNKKLEKRIIQKLKLNNCEFEKIKYDCHDRYWICLETQKGVSFGTSINGLGKSTSSILELQSEDVLSVISEAFDGTN